MTDNKDLREFLIRNNPNVSATQLYENAKSLGISNRKTDFLKEVRTIRQLPEPTKIKKEKSVPTKYKKAKPTVLKPKVVKPTVPKPKAVKPTKLPFEKTKFGKIVKKMKKQHGISEKKAIKRARALLKIPRKDYTRLNQKDVNIILSESP